MWCPELSIIVPVYNTELYLDACLGSVFEQKSSVNFEVILVDDGSSDSSPKICDFWAQLHENVLFVRQDNKGAAAARNTGLRHVDGRMVMFLDSDDVLLPGSLDKMTTAFKETNVDLLLCDGVRNYGPENSKILPILDGDEFYLSGKDRTRELLRRFMDSPTQTVPLQVCWAKLFDANFLKSNNLRFNEAPKAWEDLEFMFKVLCKARTILYRKIPACMSFRRVRECVSTNNVIKYHQSLNYLSIKMFSDLHRMGLPDAEELYWKFYTTFSATALYKMHQYVRPGSLFRILTAARELLANRELRDHMNFYDPVKNNNWPVLKKLLAGNHPWLVLLAFWLQGKVAEVKKRFATGCKGVESGREQNIAV